MKQLKLFFSCFLMLLVSATAFAQSQVSGNVSGSSGEPIVGASVLVKGTTNRTITDADGNFKLNNAKGTLVISFLGYKTKEVAISGNIAKIVLVENAEILDEIVVVGYGIQKKTTLSGSVSQVKGEDVLKGKATQSMATALQGTIPGLTITRTSSRPGNENTTITLRGGISVNQSDPMILIDGVEAYTWELSQMNPNDVESISVLKDAAAAIYGTKAGAGVILVTTKRGKEGKTKVTYNGAGHVNYIGNRFPLADGVTFCKMMVQTVKSDQNTELNPSATANQWWMWTSTNDEGLTVWERMANGERIADVVGGSYRVLDPSASSNQFNAIYGTTWGESHNITINGGSNRAKTITSFGYADDRSLLTAAYDGQKKYNFRTNADYKVNDWIKTEVNLSYDKRITATPTQGVGQGVQDFYIFPLYNDYGQFYDTFGSNNVLAKLKTGGQTTTTNEVLRIGGKVTIDLNKAIKGLSLNASANYRIRRSLKVKRNIGITLYDWAGEKLNGTPYYGEYATNGTGYAWKTAASTDNTVTNTITNTDYQVYNAFANWSRKFTEHTIGLMAGATAEKTSYWNQETYRSGMSVSELDDINLGDATTSTNSGGSNEVGMISCLGRLNYDYKSIYLLEGTFRRDGSSRFSADNRWANFTGVSSGIRLSELGIVKDLNTFNNLKLRVSYGETGSEFGIGEYDYLSTITTGTTVLNGAKVNTSYITGMTSSDRTWERVATTNFGLDFAVLNNRLSGTLEVYHRENKGMLISMTYPQTLGASAPKTNSGNFQSNGWEIQLNWQDKIGNDFSYNVGFNLADAHTKVTEYNGAVAISAGINNTVLTTASATGSFIEGKPLNALYVYKTDGYLQTLDDVESYYTACGNGGLIPTQGTNNQLTPGCVKKVDLTDDGKITTDDLYYYGDANPHYTFGLNLGAAYKGFDFSMFIQGVGQQYIIRTGALSSPWNVTYQNQNATFYGKTWTTENTDAEYPIMSRVAARNNWNYKQFNDINVTNCWYARAKNMALGYTIPKNIVSKAGVEKLRLYVAADNLFEVSNVKDGFDPEAQAASGQGNVDVYARTVSFGVDLTF